MQKGREDLFIKPCLNMVSGARKDPCPRQIQNTEQTLEKDHQQQQCHQRFG